MTPRLISYPVHAALDLLVGVATMIAPFVLGFAVAPAVAAVALGALLVGLALYGTPDERGIVGLPIGAHRAYDEAMAFALVAIGAGALLAGDQVAALALAALGIVQLGLRLTTRYSLPSSIT